MNRVGLKISCFIVSVVIWMQVASTADVEKTAHLPVGIEGLREGLTIEGSDVPESIPVSLTGSKLRLMAHEYFGYYVGEVKISMAEHRPGPAFYIDPLAENVYSDLQVPPVIQAASFEVRVDTLVTRLVPVTLNLRGQLDSRFGFVTPPAVSPDSVAVIGPSRFFPDRFSVRTDPVDLSRVDGSSQMELALVPPHGYLRLASDEVKVAFAVGSIEERTLANVPVIPLVDAGRPAVGISPPVADIMVRGVADSVATLTADRLSVVVPVNDLPEGVYEMSGQVEHPSWVTLIGMDPSVFQVIVGNPSLLPDSSLVAPPEAESDE
jgi:YbbR domain-containing protein